MKKKLYSLFGAVLVICFWSTACLAINTKVFFISLDGDTINPATAEYITTAIDQSAQNHAECLVIKLDTPGGLLESTRVIVKKMLISSVPIIVYISPSGSRAGSAGVFITYASHVAAMAPSTNIGAAHPIQLGGQQPAPKSSEWDELRRLVDELKSEKLGNGPSKDNTLTSKSDVNNGDDEKSSDNFQSQPGQSVLEGKILNDTVAFIKGIAHLRGRNVDWAVDSVTKSSSITEQEALANHVVEIIAGSDDDLLRQLDGRRVSANGVERVLSTKDAEIVRFPMAFRQNFFNILANPNIAYFLLILGFYGLLYEITHPGIGFPGVAGAVFLILAFYSMQALPTNYAGVALLMLGFILLIAEAYVPGFGLLTLGGVVCIFLGSLLLFNSNDPSMRVSYAMIGGVVALSLVFSLVILRSIISTLRRKVATGQEGLIGEIGKTDAGIKIGEEGKVFVHGEIWNARSTVKIDPNERVKVVRIEGLTLWVDKI